MHAWRHGIQRVLLFTALLLALLAVCGTLAEEKRDKRDTHPRTVWVLERTSKFVSFFVLALMFVMFFMLCKSFWEVVVLEKREVSERQLLKTTRVQEKDKLALTITGWAKDAKKTLGHRGESGREHRALTGPNPMHLFVGTDRASQFTEENPMHMSTELTLSHSEARAAARLAKLTASVAAPSLHSKRNAGARGGAGVTLAGLAAEEAAEKLAEEAAGRPTDWNEIDLRNVALTGSLGSSSHRRACNPEELAANRALELGRRADRVAELTSTEVFSARSAGGRLPARAEQDEAGEAVRVVAQRTAEATTKAALNRSESEILAII